MKISIRPAISVIGFIAVSKFLTAQTGGLQSAPRGSSTPPPATFGTTAYSVTSVDAAAFSSLDTFGDQILTLNGERYFSATSSGHDFIGSVSIPEGVIIDFIGINNCDPAGGSFTFSLYDATPGTTGGDFTLIDSLTTNVNACLVDYNSSIGALGYSYPKNAGHNLHVRIVQNAGTPTGGTAGVRGVEVWWRRQVSPAPATSDFGDVPTSSPQFQFIEALYHSGVTAGCGGGNYCPDNPLTRGQMAVFLAKALGLHWPETPVP